MWTKAKGVLTTTCNNIKNFISATIGKINWVTKKTLTPEEFDEIRKLLVDNYYIIASRHNGHLSTYAIEIAHCVLTGKRGYYGHVFMNLEDTVESDDSYRFIEATGTGVHYSGFSAVFDNQTSSVALLKPKYMPLSDWTAVLDASKTYLGRPYDTLFNLADDNALSCVELVRDALKGDPDYLTNFANFEAMISADGNLDPQMFLECPDFEVVWEKRH
jgi:hypothetical protein